MTDEQRPAHVTPGKPAHRPLLLLATGLLLGIAVTYAFVVHRGDRRDDTRPSVVRVFGPWSMEKRLRRIFEKFQAEQPGVDFELVTGTPGSLAERMRAGDVPDVYVSMGPVGLDVLQKEGVIRPGSGGVILKQRMVLVCSEAMKDIVKDVKDLAKGEVRKVGIGRPAMSAGRFARQALAKEGILDVVEAKSQKSPLRSLLKGEVDAAVILGQCCYQEDLLAGKLVPLTGLIVVRHLPDELVPEFPVIAVTTKGTDASEPARRLVEFLSGKVAQAILRREGPGACPVCDGGICPIPK